MTFEELINFFKDSLFPVHCVDCGQEGQWLCKNCFKNINPIGVFCCPVCHQNNGTGKCCNNCLTNSSLDRTLAVLPYRAVVKVIENFKYHYAEELVGVIEIIIKDFLKNHPGLFTGAEKIIPVPLHPRRLAERGFNQAELIAKILASELNLPVEQVLTRSRFTRQQAKLSQEERKQNVESVFASLTGLSGVVLLVDDVFTTGTTMQECARVLLTNGAEKIIGFTLARG